MQPATNQIENSVNFQWRISRSSRSISKQIRPLIEIPRTESELNSSNDLPTDIPTIIIEPLNDLNSNKLTVYMTGVTANIVNDFSFQKSIAFQAALTACNLRSGQLCLHCKNSFRITVNSEHQRQQLLAAKSILDTKITVPIPISTSNKRYPLQITKPQPEPFLFHGVIKVPIDIEQNHIQEALAKPPLTNPSNANPSKFTRKTTKKSPLKCVLPPGKHWQLSKNLWKS